MSEENGRATTASIDRRVERLEGTQAEFGQQLALVSLEQGHIRELMNSRFSSIEAQITVQGSKLDSFMARIDAVIAQGQASAGDLVATPAGRYVKEQLDELDLRLASAQRFQQRISGLTLLVPVLSAAASVVAVGISLGWF